MNRLVERMTEIVKNDERFSLDEVWKWVGFSSRQMAEKRLLVELEEGLDFNYNEKIIVQMEGNRKVKRPHKDYEMTEKGFELFAASAHTERGKEIRRTLINIVHELKDKVEESKSTLSDSHDEFNNLMMKGLLILENRQKVYERRQNLLMKNAVKQIEKVKLPAPIDEEKEELKKRLKYAEESLGMIQNKLSGKGTKYDPDTYFWNK